MFTSPITWRKRPFRELNRQRSATGPSKRVRRAFRFPEATAEFEQQLPAKQFRQRHSSEKLTNDHQIGKEITMKKITNTPLAGIVGVAATRPSLVRPQARSNGSVALPAGTHEPDFALESTLDQTVRLSELHGQMVVLV